jgi:hypothetical protein
VKHRSQLPRSPRCLRVLEFSLVHRLERLLSECEGLCRKIVVFTILTTASVGCSSLGLGRSSTEIDLGPWYTSAFIVLFYCSPCLFFSSEERLIDSLNRNSNMPATAGISNLIQTQKTAIRLLRVRIQIRASRGCPRWALLRMPPRKRAFSTWSSASLIVPFSPSRSRSLKWHGSRSPPSSRLSVPLNAQISSNRCQSAQLGARRDTSSPITMPAWPGPTSVTSFWKPSRSENDVEAASSSCG